ncbi:fibronectin type III domain-containing protein [Aequorivita sp. Q41]|uniref:fibronectin type III domain-containing protein n=1 Tax=Aequorivita sp. Q41 TaxID=3153300 RepID=UPI0032427327
MKKIKILTVIMFLGMAYWPASAQFLESFDTEIPREWRIHDNDGQGGTWHYNAGDGYRGPGGARITFEENAHDDYLISPQFTVNSGISDYISFYAGGSGVAHPETFDVKLSTTGADPADFTVVLGSEITITDVDDLGEYVNYAYNLAAYDGQDVFIAIVATSTAAFRFYVDEFSVEALPRCPKPSSFEIENLTATTLDLNWRAGGSENEWVVKYGLSGFDPETEGETKSVVGSPNTSLSGLESGALLDIYIKAVCDNGNGESEFGGPLRFFTPCLAATVPFFEGFENGYAHNDNLGGCWSQELIQNTYWKTNNSITANNRAPRTGDWNIYLAYGSENWMFYPIEVQGGISYTLTFYARQSNTLGATVTASYGVSNDSGAMINRIIPTTEITQGDYQEVTGAFIPDTTGVIYIGVNAQVGPGFYPFYLSMDDLSVTESQTCLKPVNMQIDEAMPTSAIVSWTPGASETDWLVKYGEPGFDPLTDGLSAVVSGSANVSLTDLIPAHIYNVFVKSVCGGSDGNSYYTGPITLKTTPVNDMLCNATPLVVDAACTGSSYTNVGATLEVNERMGTCYDAAGEQTVWFSFEAPASGNVTVTTDFERGTLEDTELAVFAAPSDCANLATLGAEVGCDEDGGNTGTGFLATVTLTDLIAGDTYFVQINGFMSFDDGTMEGTFCIEVNDDGVSCPQPTDISVTNVSTNSAEVSWRVSGNETAWEVKYGALGFDPNTAGMSVIDADGDPGQVLTDLDPDTAYEVYVRALCATDDESEYTGPESFNTMQLAVANENFSSFMFYPNPIKDKLNLSAKDPIEKIEVYSLLGQKIIEVRSNTSQVQLNTNAMQQGVYFIKVTINKAEKVFRVVKE